MTASGGESITQCSNHDDKWCCNADATHVDCCQESPEPRPFFALQDGAAYATIGSMTASTAPNLAKFTGRASGSSSDDDDDDDSSSASKTSAPQSTNAASSSGSGSSSSGALSEATATEEVASTGTPFTSVSISLSTGSTGVVSVPITNVITPTPTSTGNGTEGAANGDTNGTSGADADGGSSSNLGLIIGCAVGIPLGLAIIGLIIWLLRKRRQQKASAYHQTAEMDGDNGSFVGAAAGKLGKKQKFRNSAAATAEIDGNPIGAGRPVSTVNGRAELPSGNGFQPGQGTPYGPDAVGIGGGNGRNTWDTMPPQYSPGNHQTTFAYPDATELADTSVMRSVNEKGEPYAPYRPPHPVAEMPSVTTPPEDIEKQMQR